MAKRRHATLARFEGAATGVGGVITLVPDLVGLAWIQTRLVFFVAAAYGYDPHDPMRPAELLVLMDLYDDAARARAPRSTGSARRSPRPTSARRLEREEALALRLARMLGRRGVRRVAGPPDPVRRDRLQRGRQRAQHARARRPAIRFYGG